MSRHYQRIWVTFAVHTDRLSFTRGRGERVVEPGTVEFFAARSSVDVVASEVVELVGPTRRVAPGQRVLTTEVGIV